MRLWSLHPRYLDARGLVALWREALLARAVLRGETHGYRSHPQLQRFREHAAPRRAIDAYLASVHAEALARGYRFDAGKFSRTRDVAPIRVTRGQLVHELRHLRAKLRRRDPAGLRRLPKAGDRIDPHPLFRTSAGPVAAWERRDPRARRRPPRSRAR